jgi:hypothetical protein
MINETELAQEVVIHPTYKTDTFFVAQVLSGVTGDVMPFRTPLANGLSEDKFAEATCNGIRNAGATVLDWGYEYGVNEDREAMTEALKNIPIRSVAQSQYENLVNKIVGAYV